MTSFQQSSFTRASTAYGQVYRDGPYTNLDMIQYLIDKSTIISLNDQTSRQLRQATIEDYVSNPNLVRAVTSHNMLEDDINDGGALHQLFAGRTGLCTSFAIKTVDRLKHRHPADGYDFVFYDLGQHRLAICKNTKILIDSSASKAVKLEDGKELTVNKQVFLYKNQHLSFRRTYENVNRFREAETLDAKVALIRCLEQLARNDKAELLCFFRGYLRPPKRRLGFDGMIKWVPTKKVVELSWLTQSGLMVQEIRFGSGNEASNQKCINEIEDFLNLNQHGIDRMEQFSCVQEWHEKMWDNAAYKWGYPTLLQPIRVG